MLLGWVALGCVEVSMGQEIDPPGRGPFPVGTTNVEVAEAYESLSTGEMLSVLNRSHEGGLFVDDILANPESAWLFEVTVPSVPSLYGQSSGRRMVFGAFIAYPTSDDNERTSYVFPYADASDGIFEHMERVGDEPIFRVSKARYPLVVLSHGLTAHGLYDVTTAKTFASNGYIAMALFHGDGEVDRSRNDLYALRPLAVKEAIDSVLESEAFGPHIDVHRIGVYGHSFGGMTVLSSLGGRMFNHPSAVTDARIRAGVGMEPSFWRQLEGVWYPLFGTDNEALARVKAPYMSINGTEYVVAFDELDRVSGTRYAIQLPGQPHVFEGPSWNDAMNWGIVFFDAYLKDDRRQLELLNEARSVKGFNADYQLSHLQYLEPVERISAQHAYGSDGVREIFVERREGGREVRVLFAENQSDVDLYYDLQYSADGEYWVTLNAEREFPDETLTKGKVLPEGYVWSSFVDRLSANEAESVRLYRVRCDRERR